MCFFLVSKTLCANDIKKKAAWLYVLTISGIVREPGEPPVQPPPPLPPTPHPPLSGWLVGWFVRSFVRSSVCPSDKRNVFEERTCLTKFTCCHTVTEVADQACCLIQPQCSHTEHRLVGLVVRAPTSRAEDPRFDSSLRRDLSGSNQASDKNWHSSFYPASRLAL